MQDTPISGYPAIYILGLLGQSLRRSHGLEILRLKYEMAVPGRLDYACYRIALDQSRALVG